MTTVPLVKPIVTHEGNVTEIILREPKGRDFLELGEPWVWTKGPGGESVSTPVPDIINAYVERCVEKPDPVFLAQLGLSDGMRVRQALLDFFPAAVRAAFPDPATSSSGKPESAPQASGSV